MKLAHLFQLKATVDAPDADRPDPRRNTRQIFRATGGHFRRRTALRDEVLPPWRRVAPRCRGRHSDRWTSESCSARAMTASRSTCVTAGLMDFNETVQARSSLRVSRPSSATIEFLTHVRFECADESLCVAHAGRSPSVRDGCTPTASSTPIYELVNG